jgi:hypothetical protein
VRKLSPVEDEQFGTDDHTFEAIRMGRPILRVRRTSTDSGHDGVCNAQQASRGMGPTWVRIEIHRTGLAQTLKANGGDEQPLAKTATFKWRIGNGAAVYAVAQNRLKVPDFVRGAPFEEDAWVERFPADLTFPGELRLIERRGDSEWGLAKSEMAAAPAATHPVIARGRGKQRREFVRAWHPNGARIDVSGNGPQQIDKSTALAAYGGASAATVGDASHPVLVDDGAALVVTNLTRNDGWIRITADVEIQFESTHDSIYRTGDYWLIRVDPDGTVTVNGQGNKSDKDGYNDIPSGMVRAFAPLAKRNTDDIDGWDRFRRQIAHATVAASASPAVAPASLAAQLPQPDTRQSGPSTSGSRALLSPDGVNELRRHVSLPQDILRRIPARYLAFTPRTQTVRRWMSTALVSELVKQDVAALAERLRPVAFTVDEWSDIEADARELVDVADQFSAVMSSEEGVRELLA